MNNYIKHGVVIALATSLLLLILLREQSFAQSTAEMRPLRTPAIHGDNIVFGYAGDLWVTKVGAETAAWRLTNHPGLEIRPKISPDGSSVVFTGSYDGTDELYIIPIEGGAPRRLTYDPNYESAIGWTPDGKIAYGSSAGNISNNQMRLWYTDPQGGLPIWTPIGEISEATFFPDGHTIAYSRVNSYDFNWQRYGGGVQGKISFYDFEKNAYSEAPAQHGQNNNFPMVVGRSVFYIGDKSYKTLNLYRYDLDNRQHTQLTRYTDGNIRSPSTDGKSIVWVKDGFLYVYDIASGKSTKLSPRISKESLVIQPALKQLGNQISSISISPSGTQVAAEARGEIFSIPAQTGETRNLTRSSGARERFPRWSPDGEKIAYLSDVTGNWEAYVQPQVGGEATRLTQSNGEIAFSDLGWSPDGRFLELNTSTNDVYILNVETRELTKILTGLFGIRSSDWSPDSRWLAMTVTGSNRLASLYLYEIATRRLTKVTEGYYSDNSVTFDLNGKYLYLLSRRTFTPSLGSFEFSTKVENTDRIYVIPLGKDTPNPLRTANEEGQNSSTSVTKATAAGVREVPPTVRIDMDGLADRMLPLPMPAGNYPTIAGAKNGVLYATRTTETPGITLAKFDLGSREPQKIFQGSLTQLAFNRARTHLAAYGGGRLSVIEIRAGADLTAGQVKTESVTATIDPRKEWRQIFWEAWRFQRQRFFDPKMRGIDWTAVGRKYEQYLPFVGSRSDLNYVIGLMISELRTSHGYVFGGDSGTLSSSIPIGLLGADYDAVGDYVRFKKIYYGQNFDEARRGPLGEAGYKVREGEYLLAIDGEPVNAKVHPNSLLLNKANKYVTLTVNSQPKAEGSRKISVRTISNENNLRYAEWVEANRRYVEKASGGRIGYLHLPNVGIAGVTEFIRGFYGQTHKDALIIDERWNTGGMTGHGLFDLLSRKRMMRLSEHKPSVGDLFDVNAIEGPKVMLINEYAGSGGDSVPYIFRKLGLGTLIGKRTLGASVGQASLSLIDGGTVTAANKMVYDPQTGKQMAENVGTFPDIEMDMRPDLVAQGQDPQLNAAIKHLMERLQKIPPKSREDIAP
jgi:tricorn protease